MRLAYFLLLLAACGVTPIVVPVQLRQGIVDPVQVKSFQLFILDQIGRDQNPLTCEALLNRAVSPGDDVVVQVRDPIEGSFDGNTEIRIDDVPRGDKNRLFYIDLFDQPDLLGERIGAGCAPSVTVVGGKSNKLVLEIVTPPKAVVD